MIILIDPRVHKWLNRLSKGDLALVRKYLKLFKEYNFGLNQKYLKKIDNNLWELRPGRVRLFLTEVKPNIIVIHALVKKSQKITKETRQIIQIRLKEYA